MADRSDISSEDLKKRWLSDADKREKNGDKAGAKKYYEKALPLYVRFGDPYSEGICRARLKAMG